jgi:hypothetical protein
MALGAVLAVVGLTANVVAAQAAEASSIQTRIGKIEVEDGYPSQASLAKLTDELDFQRACQAYIWALPIVGTYGWKNAQDRMPNGQGRFVLYEDFDQKLGILTPNFNTPYFIGFGDLAKTGPLVIEMPKALIAGMIMDAWQRSLTDMGAVGPDRGQGAKFLIVGPGQQAPEVPTWTFSTPDGYYIIHSPTHVVFYGGRLLDPDREKAIREVGPLLRTYPWSQHENPPRPEPMAQAGTGWMQTQPRGIAYWEVLAQALVDEPVEERDRFFMAMLKPLGIEKGKPFKPDARQRKILTEAAEVGELMAKANTYTKRFAKPYWPGTHWKDAVVIGTTQREADHEQLDERASWYYEATVISEAMRSRVPGFGQRYMGTYQDKDGHWLVGGKSYRLHVPANPPATQFWSVTIYDEKNRLMLVNKAKRPDVSSRDTSLVKNADGSVDVYVGPSAPKGFEHNWVQTKPGEGWFALFRFYGPTEKMFDRSWVLGDFEKVK